VRQAPVDAERTRLYTAEELYDAPAYADTLDARAYAWSRTVHSRECARLQALHDFGVDEALDAWVAGRRVVGVMGGHAALRGDVTYRQAARLGHALGQTHVVATGGGPGAMEAANLGAWLAHRSPDSVDAAIEQLSAVPGFAPSIQDWMSTALAVRATYDGRPRPTSLGIPTWFYGHEPPNVFCDVIAKYFRNAIREAILVGICDAGIVFLPGAAGTVQEIFQDACDNYYADAPKQTPMVLVGREHWTQEVPAWPLLHRLADNRPMAAAISLVDSIEDAVAALTASSAR
jgi:predicted Rossmann-fold nucleotide-binding protein